ARSLGRYAGGVLRTKTWRSSSLRLLDNRDRDEGIELCDRDPGVNVFISSRGREAGLDPSRLGGQMWGYQAGGGLGALRYPGARRRRDHRLRGARRAAGPPLLVDRRPGGGRHGPVGAAAAVLGAAA